MEVACLQEFKVLHLNLENKYLANCFKSINKLFLNEKAEYFQGLIVLHYYEIYPLVI